MSRYTNSSYALQFCKKNEATVHLTQIVEDKMQKVDLCEECAKEKGVNDPTGFSLADLLLGLGASQEMEQAAGGAELKCPRCGFTQADFKKAGRLGCSECYTDVCRGPGRIAKDDAQRHPSTWAKSRRVLRQSHDFVRTS